MTQKMVLQTADDLNPPFAPRPIPPNTPSAQPTASQTLSGNVVATTGQQPVLETASNIPLTDLDSLPTITDKGGKGHKIVLANNAIEQFLDDALDLDRLNRIHGLLWMAGRPMRARPLHRYKMMGFNVLPTQQMDLHLLKFSNNMILKPLPEWMVSYDFWTKYICPKKELHHSACGFLLSYVWLITTPLDLKLAHEETLLPSFVTWHWWKDFVTDFYGHVDINSLHQVHPRYQFGELRLSRINSIYRTRYFSTNFVRGYLYGYNRYVVFFQRNFSWILSVFVLFSLVLSAMQVGTSLKELEGNQTFLKGSYGFVVLNMVCVVAVMAVLVVVFAFIFLFNMGAAIDHVRREKRNRKKQAAEVRGSKERDGASC
ncbi:hypothetical protein T440DRAFT_264230 [Plenodomus tracheiphilus IPT5]|uniref:Uncharacterized protein n=1 Tax=Plenodomus tracheiphilus IPT5 TaxID=1408161 RepID=A0A6A7ATU5_9PLEO|nr:hypothetical protein T440DRAFT_264230 [Plenodomus tracheiphilus IPT5]